MIPRDRAWFERDGLERDERDRDADRQTASLGGVAVALLLVVVGLFLVRTLHAESMLEDCLMAGHRNCDAMLVAGP